MDNGQKAGLIERYFHLQRYGTTVKTEILAGTATFIAIAYILLLNPQVLAAPDVILGDTATAPALIFAGVLMFSNIRDADFGNRVEALPAFCTILFMPFTYSIANGIAFGLLMCTVMRLLCGQIRDVRPLCATAALVFIVRYALMTLGRAVTPERKQSYAA